MVGNEKNEGNSSNSRIQVGGGGANKNLSQQKPVRIVEWGMFGGGGRCVQRRKRKIIGIQKLAEGIMVVIIEKLRIMNAYSRRRIIITKS